MNDIIKGCLSNDRDCQKALYERYAASMLGVCRRYARHGLEADDMLQDGFITLFRNMDQYHGTGSFEAWMRRIIINTCLKHIRKFSFQKENIGIEETEITKVEPEVLSQLSEEALLEMIDQLPVGYKNVFNLYAIEGYNHQEISKMLGIREGTSRSQLVKARKMLQKFIGNALNAFI